LPKIAYIEKNFHNDSLALIQRINGVIESYRQQGYSLTLRQVYYQMVARDIIPNNERSYKNLGNLINDARMAGLIDWNAIEDRTRNLRGLSHWTEPSGVISSAAYSYHLDHWQGQPNYVEVWVEKDALIGVVGQISEKLDVNHFSCRGYVSQSEMWGAAQRLQNAKCRIGAEEVYLLHLGDHDPSGKDMSRDIVDRLALFGTDIHFRRLALNMDQIDQYNPPPNPAKVTDSRYKTYTDEYGEECWELDALEPSVISELIRKNVEPLRDNVLFRKVKDREEYGRELLNRVSKNWETIADNLDAILETEW
jgi:hypothetical protein